MINNNQLFSIQPQKSSTLSLNIRHLGLMPYEDVWLEMKHFSETRTDDNPDELWLLQHPPVYTLGQAGKHEHILNPSHIPVIQTDRGGQVTYHGPGQLVAYVMISLERYHLNIRELVTRLEKILIDMLQELNISAHLIPSAPGVYVNQEKIASIGLRIKRGFSYHGIALNVNMDLAPFSGINPCGYSELTMTQIQHFIPDIHLEKANELFTKHFLTHFNGL